MMMILLVLFFAARAYSRALPEFLCKGCLQISQGAQEFLTNPDNLDTAIGLVKTYGCANIDGDYQAKCNEMAEEYLSAAFATLQEHTTPQHMCLETRVCPPATASSQLNSHKQGGNNCPLCRYAVMEMKMKLEDPKTREKLLQFLLENCQKLKKRENECKLLVLEYGPQILANLDLLLDDDELCTRIGMCPAKPLLRDAM